MRANVRHTRQSRELRATLAVMTVLCFVFLTSAGTAHAVSRSSTSYSMSLDAQTAGGGAAASASYRQADSAVGEAVGGLAAGASRSAQAGVVQAWGLLGEPPTVVSVIAVDERSFRVTFSLSMDTGVENPANYTLTGDGSEGTLAAHPDSVTFLVDRTYLLVWTSGSTVSGGVVTITVGSGVRSLGGAPMGSPNSGVCATVGPGLSELSVPVFESAPRPDAETDP